MNCPKCGKEILQPAAFCMHCGAQFGPAVAPGNLGKSKDSRYLIWGGVALLLLLALLGAPRMLAAFGKSGPGGLLEAEGATGTQTLQARGATGTGILQAKGSNSSGILKADDSHAVMPDDVRKWLEHLARIERLRGQLSTKQLSAAIVTMTELQLGGGLDAINSMLNDSGTNEELVSPATSTKKEFESYQTEWIELNKDFESMAPPQECIPIRDEYKTVLVETGNMIVEIMKQIDSAAEDPKKAVAALTTMKGTSDERIGKPSISSDGLVADICNKYETRKWFSISNDFGSGLFGKLGL